QTAAPSSKPAYGGGNEAHPGHAKAESNTGNGGALAPRGSEAVLQYAPLLLSCRFWCAARCTPKSLQRLAHAPSFLALSQRKTCRFPLSSHCPICLTNLH